MQPDSMPCLVPGRKVDRKMIAAGIEKNDRTLPLLKEQDEKHGDEDRGKQV